jgi:NADPH:quinone reductase-like Zn-dependent oxidoreductase
MKVWRDNGSPEAPGLLQAEVETPKPGPGELLIRVHAAGVTPTELFWFPTTHRKSGEPRSHAVPGHEFSGVVAGIGAGVAAPFEVGQEVFGMNDWFADGATAEFCCTLPSAVAPKPVRLSHVEAASVPIGALTAWQGLFERTGLRTGERVLIHGGSGGVGVFAIQFARQRGADVLTTASARHRDFLVGLGARQVIDYRTERFEDAARGVDVVFDAVGGQTLERSWAVLGPGGRLVTIAAESEESSDERTEQAFFIVEPNQTQLRLIAEQLDSGRLRPVVESVVPFDQAGSAYTRPPTQRRGCGKTVVAVIPPD